MALAQQGAQVFAPAPASSAAPVNPTADLARALPGFDAGPVIDAHDANLADYLNQPVHELLARLGLAGLPHVARPADAANPNGGPPAGAANSAANSAMPGMLAGLLTQMIGPVTEALGMLGPGVFDSLDPTQMFGGISQVLE